jgi:nitrite reductase/ring-hydroxylating ferredoxin subunit
MKEILVGEVSAFGERDRKIVVEGDHEIGVFRLGDGFFAWENTCPHMGGPVCQGRILNRVDETIDADGKSQGMRWVEEDVHLICPWHGFEFNLKTGRHPGEPNTKLKGYETVVKEGKVYVLFND